MKRPALLTLLLVTVTAASAQTRTVNIGLGYIPNVQFTPFYVADRLGYFKAESLNVKYQHGFINELMPLLLQGKLDFVVGDPEDVIFARNQGAPVKYVMAMYQKNPVTVFSTRPLSRAADLKGMTVGIPGPYGSSYNAIQAVLDEANLQEGRDVKLATIGYTQLDAVRGGKVDAAVGYINNDVVQLRAAGTSVNTLDLSGAYPMVGVGLITLEKNLSGDLARKVVRASQRGLKFTVANPAQAFKTAQPVFGKNGGTLDVLKASTPLISSAYAAQNGLGASNPANWAKAVAALVKLGKLPANTKATDFYTNTLISKTLK